MQEELMDAENRLTISQKAYSEARKEWFDLAKEVEMAAMPVKMDVRYQGNKTKILVADFGDFSVELKSDAFPDLDGSFKLGEFNYDDAEVSIGGEILHPPQSVGVAKKMFRLYSGWQKMKSMESQADMKGAPESVAKDVFNIE